MQRHRETQQIGSDTSLKKHLHAKLESRDTILKRIPKMMLRTQSVYYNHFTKGVKQYRAKYLGKLINVACFQIIAMDISYLTCCIESA